MVFSLKYIIALLTTGAAVWGMQCKKMKYVILGQIIANSLLGLQYVIEGAFSAAVTIPPALALTIISFYYDAKNKPIPKNLIKAFIGIFAAVIVGQSVIEAVTGKAMLNAASTKSIATFWKPVTPSSITEILMTGSSCGL